MEGAHLIAITDMPSLLIAQLPAGKTSDVLSMVLHSGLVVRGVLLILAVASIITWAIIILKYLQIHRSLGEDRRFLDIFWQSKKLDAIYETSRQMLRSPLAQVFRAGYQELLRLSKGSSATPETWTREMRQTGLMNVQRALRRTMIAQTNQVESKIIFLATCASAAPFIGLFGTVWGIMDSFRAISTAKNVGLQVVAPGISEALIATAFGLAAAIPAVVAYNYFVNRIKRMEDGMENFSSDLLNILESYFFSSGGGH